MARKYISKLSTETLIEILCWCSPADLLALLSVCKVFHNILVHQKLESIWRDARERLQVPAPPSIEQNEASPWNRQWSERQFAAFLFWESCSVCHKSLKALPCYYFLAFGIRVCDASSNPFLVYQSLTFLCCLQRSCLINFFKCQTSFVHTTSSNPISSPFMAHRHRYRSWLPSHQTPHKGRVHLSKQIMKADAEFLHCQSDPVQLLRLEADIELRIISSRKVMQVSQQLVLWKRGHDNE
ncbi:hypothetical protein C8J56DRAFT_1167390, partial [Mycena floridula]